MHRVTHTCMPDNSTESVSVDPVELLGRSEVAELELLLRLLLTFENIVLRAALQRSYSVSRIVEKVSY